MEADGSHLDGVLFLVQKKEELVQWKKRSVNGGSVLVEGHLVGVEIRLPSASITVSYIKRQFLTQRTEGSLNHSYI